MRKFIGIDLHSNNSVVVVADEDDRVVYQKRLPNNWEAIAAALVPHRDETVGVVIESTYNWYWLVDGADGRAGIRRHPWRTRRRSRSTRGSSTAGILPMRRIWRSCCGWGCWPRAVRLSARATRRTGSGAQAHAACALSHGPGLIDRGHPDAADGKPPQGRGRQTADGRAGRGVWFCA